MPLGGFARVHRSGSAAAAMTGGARWTIPAPRPTLQALPARGRLVPGHCVIVPADHVASTRQVDEQVSVRLKIHHTGKLLEVGAAGEQQLSEHSVHGASFAQLADQPGCRITASCLPARPLPQVWTELRNFKKCLIQMFMKQAGCRGCKSLGGWVRARDCCWVKPGGRLWLPGPRLDASQASAAGAAIPYAGQAGECCVAAFFFPRRARRSSSSRPPCSWAACAATRWWSACPCRPKVGERLRSGMPSIDWCAELLLGARRLLARAALRLFWEAGRRMSSPVAHAVCRWEAAGRRKPSRCLNGIGRVGSKAELGQLQQLNGAAPLRSVAAHFCQHAQAKPACLIPTSLPVLHSTGSAAAAKAPMFFKKAIDDATSEWAQHHAKRYIDTKAKVSRGNETGGWGIRVGWGWSGLCWAGLGRAGPGWVGLCWGARFWQARLGKPSATGRQVRNPAAADPPCAARPAAWLTSCPALRLPLYLCRACAGLSHPTSPT